MGSADLIRITGADASNGGAEFVFAEGFFAQLVFFFVIIQNQMRIFTYQEPVVQRDVFLGQCVDFLYDCVRVNDDGICDYADDILPNHPAGQKVQCEPVVAHDNGVAGVGAAAVSDNDIAVLGENVNNLAFALIAPL